MNKVTDPFLPLKEDSEDEIVSTDQHHSKNLYSDGVTD